MWEEVMAADAEDEVATADSSTDATDATDDSSDDGSEDFSSIDESQDQNTSDTTDQDQNGDRDDLIDYLDNDKSDLSTVAETTEWKNELQKNDVEGVTNYLDSDKGAGEYREMFDRNGNHITAKDAKSQIGQDQFKAVIYNPELNFNKEQLHELANKMIDAKSEKLGKQIDAVYAVHMRSDGTNGHIHVVYHSPTKSDLTKAQVDHTKLSKSELKDWIVERAEITNSVQEISSKEKQRNYERLSSIEGKNRDNGSQRRDATIERYMGKQEHNEGNFSITQVEKSFDYSIQKGTMTPVQKDRLISEVRGRCKTHVKNGLAEKIGNDKYKFDRAAWQEHIEKQNIAKQERVNQRVNNFLSEKYRNYKVENTFNYNHQQKDSFFRDFKINNSSSYSFSASTITQGVSSSSTPVTVNSVSSTEIKKIEKEQEKEERKRQKKLLKELSL